MYQGVTIIAVDWGKDTGKRAAYISELPSRTISRLAFDGTLAHLVDYASSLSSPVLIGIDAAIGFPASSWESLHEHSLLTPRSFVDYLLAPSLPADFFEPVTRPEDWSPQRPFIRPPNGKWSLKAFLEASHQGLYRQIDIRLHAKPIFVMCGMPGSVGSGTRALWQELVALKNP